MLSFQFIATKAFLLRNTFRGLQSPKAERLRAYGTWSLENFATIKGTIKAHTTINNNFMDDLNIPNTERDLSVPTLNLARTFKVTLPGTDNSTYKKHATACCR